MKSLRSVHQSLSNAYLKPTLLTQCKKYLNVPDSSNMMSREPARFYNYNMASKMVSQARQNWICEKSVDFQIKAVGRKWS